ncbi:DUF7344 domain-containing protein [Haloprofundus salilacus]|uniref:DUF7344 domain-containing protein n=1 Tax=Haloprofundus salilacus TaxID=2876190 RepID=UPI001CCC8844|nr:hypothetical protein [Haloprofundus salilacus]
MYDRPVDSSTPDIDSRPVTSLSTGQLQTLFASSRRQQVVRAIRTYPRPISLDTLVDAVVAQNPEDVPDEAAVRKRLRVALYHVDLPKLDEAEIICFDGDERVVTDVTDDIDGIRLQPTE